VIKCELKISVVHAHHVRLIILWKTLLFFTSRLPSTVHALRHLINFRLLFATVGVTASSIGVILKMLNLRPTAIKIDPYLNVDAGTLFERNHPFFFFVLQFILAISPENSLADWSPHRVSLRTKPVQYLLHYFSLNGGNIVLLRS
jgi:CTP synthase N-terminus